MIRFALKLCLLLPLLAGMAWVNWTVDPAILFPEHMHDPARHDYENVVANDLLAGRLHHLKMTHLELVVDELIFRARPDIDTLVLGTSVAKPIHEGLFGSRNFFNGSIFGGGIQQMIMVYQLALDCGLHPRHILIEINGKSLQKLQMAPPESLQRALRRMNIPYQTERSSIWPAIWHSVIPGPPDERGPFYPYDEVISPRYFQFTTEFLVQRWPARNDKPREIASQFGEANESVIYPDGSLEWWPNALLQTPESIRRRFDELHKLPIADEAYRPVPETCRLYEAFVTDLLQSGVDVEFLLLPPNPWYFEQARQEWSHKGKQLPSVDVEAFVRSLAEKHHIRVLGSLDPRQVNVKESDYVDDVHLRRAAIERFFTAPTSTGRSGPRQTDAR